MSKSTILAVLGVAVFAGIVGVIGWERNRESTAVDSHSYTSGDALAQTSRPTSQPSQPEPWENDFLILLGDLLRGAGYNPPQDSPPAGPVPDPKVKAKNIVRQLFPRFGISITTRVNDVRNAHDLPIFSNDQAREWLTSFLANFFSGPTGKNICKNLQDIAKFLKEKFGITIRIPS